MKNRNPLNLTKTERIFVFVTVILGVLADNVSSKLLLYIMPIAPETAVIGGLLRIIGNILMALAIAFIVAKMIQVFRRSGFTQKRMLALVACAACIFLVIVFNVWRYKAVQNFSQYFESTNAEINRSTLNKLNQNLPLDYLVISGKQLGGSSKLSMSSVVYGKHDGKYLIVFAGKK